MDLKEQTCTKEQALRLVELGVKPKATFYHMPAKDGPHGEYIQYGWSSEAIAPAYNVAELGDILPPSATGMSLWFTAPYTSSIRYWEGNYQGRAWGAWQIEAEARAAMLIYMLENGMMQLPAHWRQNQAEPVKEGK